MIGLRDFDDSTCDIIHKFYDTETSVLCQYGEIPARFLCSVVGAQTSNGIFAEDESEDDNEIFTYERIQAI